MKKSVLLLIAPMGSMMSFSQVKIRSGNGTPDPSAGLDPEFNDKEFLPPRMTTAERNLIINPAAGLHVYNTSSGCLNIDDGLHWREICAQVIVGSISTLDCAGADHTGTLAQGVAANDVTSEIFYTGSNGEWHSGQTVVSTGVTGLTATLSSGNFEFGSGTLVYSLSGTPSSGGTASFALNIGGQMCTLTREVESLCAESITFTYKGSSVTYGTVEGTNSRCWLDRNLGASQVATSSTDAASYGDLFQWGRGDDLHQNRNSTTTTTLSNSDQPGHGQFITLNTAPNDWRSDNNNGRWNANPIVNNPCPVGWRVPTEDEWNTESTSWGGNQNAAGALASPLKLPMAGFRSGSSAALTSVGTRGSYWTSTVSGTTSRYFNVQAAEVGVLTAGSRSSGLSVRCIQDSNSPE